MAGFVKAGQDNWIEFHIGIPQSASDWYEFFGSKRVVNLQLDGDELDAVLFGLAVFRKNHNELQQSLLNTLTELLRHGAIMNEISNDSPKIKDYSL